MVVNFIGASGYVSIARRRSVCTSALGSPVVRTTRLRSRSVERMLRIRHVAFRHRFLFRPALPYVANYPNNFHAIQRIERAENGSAERILLRKRLPDQRLIHYGDELSVGRIAITEVASAP